MKFSPRTVRFYLIIFLFFLTVLPLLAPILAHFELIRPANWIYRLYSFLCHQKASRSIFLFGQQCAWCVRDTFIWFTVLISAVVFLYSKETISPSPLKKSILLCAPMVLDGLLQYGSAFYALVNNQDTTFYSSTNLLRAVTGTLFGLGVGMYLFTRMRREIH